MVSINRRQLLLTFATGFSVWSTSVFAQAMPAIHVVKGRGCGCCTAWVNILRAEGFSVTEEERLPADLVQFKMSKGIPQDMASCHTAEINGYIIEGHVPPTDIRRLISEKPDALGLAVPGMPYGSPGMGPESEREAYEVILIRADGSSEVFTSYKAGSAN